MKNIQELIQKNKSEFNEFFNRKPTINRPNFTASYSEIKDWHTQSLKSLIDAVIEDEENSFQEAKSVRQFMATSGTGVGYNQAKQDTISKLKAIKELL